MPRAGDDWQLTAAGVALPLRRERDGQRRGAASSACATAAFVPRLGSASRRCASQAPLRLRLRHPEQANRSPASRCTNGAPTARATPASPPTWQPPLRAAPSA
ncbi:MAG: hypothetical protein V9G23_17050 [Giesbergeria sp.]